MPDNTKLASLYVSKCMCCWISCTSLISSQSVQLYDADRCTQLAWCCGWCWWRRWYITIGYCWRMALVTVGPTSILDICRSKPVQMTTVFGIVDVILKEHLTHNQCTMTTNTQRL